MGRREYEKIVEIPIQPPIDGSRPHLIELRYDPAHPPIDAWSAGYKVWDGTKFRELVRYDDDPVHDKVLHRHRASADGPVDGMEGIDAWFPGVHVSLRGARIVADIKANYATWLHFVPLVKAEDI